MIEYRKRYTSETDYVLEYRGRNDALQINEFHSWEPVPITYDENMNAINPENHNVYLSWLAAGNEPQEKTFAYPYSEKLEEVDAKTRTQAVIITLMSKRLGVNELDITMALALATNALKDGQSVPQESLDLFAAWQEIRVEVNQLETDFGAG